MARSPRQPRSVTPADKPGGDVSVDLTRTEALALLKVAETGLAVTEALHLIPNTATAESAVRKLRDAL
jgi:hypothetical protein